MFVIGGFEIPSLEGATQGDPNDVSIYEIAIMP